MRKFSKRLVILLLASTALGGQVQADTSLIEISKSRSNTHLFFRTNANIEELLNEFELSSDITVKTKETASQEFEIYYDTPELHYISTNGFLRYQTTPYLSKKNKLKQKEVVQLKDSDGEPHNYGVKHYNNIKSVEEKHSLLGIVRRNSRPLILDQLQQGGVRYPMRLKPVLKIEKLSQNIQLQIDSKDHVEIKITEMNLIDFDSTISLVQLFRNHEINVSSQQTGLSNQHSNGIADRLENSTSLSEVQYESEYQLIIGDILKTDKTFLIAFKYPALFKLGSAMFIALLGLAILLIFFIRRISNTQYSIINRYN